jgi:hypothetical protein
VRLVIAQVGAVLVEHGLDLAHAALVGHEAEELRTEIGGDRHRGSLVG